MKIKEAYKWIYIPTAAVAVLVIAVIVIYYSKFSCRIAYVDTPRLISTFSVADSVDRMLKTAQKEYEENLKKLNDSINACMQSISKEYDGATAIKKEKLKKTLSGWNTKANKYRKAGYDRLLTLQKEKMKELEQQMNPVITEYGEKHGYDIIMGTTSYGNILYGTKNKKIDITDEVAKILNERYR